MPFFHQFYYSLAVLVWIQSSRPDIRDIPNLKNADIIFQTSGSTQSSAIMFATFSPYSHMGLIKLTKSGPVVVEASTTVRETPLLEWINRGRLGRITIKRMNILSEIEANKILVQARRYYKQSYDPYFTMNDQSQYCSELVWRAYRGAGFKVGEIQKTGDLSLNSKAVRTLVANRWQSHPLCKQKKAEDFRRCWDIVLSEDIITPASIAADQDLETIYSNYP